MYETSSELRECMPRLSPLQAYQILRNHGQSLRAFLFDCGVEKLTDTNAVLNWLGY